MTSLRQRNRHNAMRAAQRAALPLFRERGFDNVTVDEVAAEAGMAASTIYRHFTTKEALVLWDEHDVAIDDALAQRLKHQPPLEAIRDAFVETLGGRYDADLEFQLARIKFIYAAEALHAAAVEADFASRDELSGAVRHFLSRRNRDAAPIIAGAAMLALDVAIERWAAGDAKRPLSALIREAFDTLAHLEALT
ncbi:MAG: TetR family transcriptional regulator [Ilumatobacter sp.]|uniref:TetR/AcrR family transcriptional regulator n=1 Tax=Ilumatobacter sp. TaxID=1967498 RepID=UPI0026278A94|nr:TetR family transcriptional regulator [Ilumatobacter sp.]MDJ0768660.1 TetR family transcriptional regulator [Ilumatobacter sp.]